jgi:hypothetical protein
LGGLNNNACAIYSVVVGGNLNTASGYVSFIGGGRFNRACLDYAAVVNGQSNCATDCYTFVGGGRCNKATALHSGVGFGSTNTASGACGFVGGGCTNVACCPYSTTVGGQANCGCDNHSFIGGGQANLVSGGLYSVVVGGCTNCTAALASAVLGGACNVACASYSGAFGCAVTNDCACSFMSNQLRACNIFAAGAVCANAGGTIVPSVSDCRLKQDIAPIGYGLCHISCLNPVAYCWNEKGKDNGTGCQIGFIAQEVKEVVPEAVFNTVSGYYGLDTNKLVPVLTAAMKEMKSCNDSMKSCQDAMSLEIETLKTLLKNAGMA